MPSFPRLNKHPRRYVVQKGWSSLGLCQGKSPSSVTCMSGLPAKVAAALTRLYPTRRSLHLGIAVSGGPDSVALGSALVELAPRRNLRLTVLHVHHGLRPEAEQEQRLVEQLCQSWRLPCLIRRLTPPQTRTGIEAWARRERYRFFHQAKEQAGMEGVAVAHTRDDQAETVLFSLLRGAGHRGLAGMPMMRDGWIIRPLLDCSRQDVLRYLSVKKLPYLTDVSNMDVRYTRNKIRHVLLPLLEREFSPRIRQHLIHLAEALREEEEWIEAQAHAAYARAQREGGQLSLPGVLAEPAALRPRLFRLWLENSAGIQDLSFRHLKNLCALTEGRITGEVELPKAMVVRREGEVLQLLPKQPFSETSSYCYPLAEGETLTILEGQWQVSLSYPLAWDGSSFGVWEADPWQAIFDADALAEPLSVRSVRAGDRMRPLGMQGHKKVHDMFADKKIAVRQRLLWPVILCGTEIIWTPGCRQGERGKVTAATRRVFRLAVNPLPEKQKLC